MDKEKDIVKKNEDNVCGCRCEVYSRVTGYYRPVGNWNRGKQEEFKDRKKFNVSGSCNCCAGN